MDRLIQDVRFALRTLRRKPGFAIATVIILGLGIGATTTIFSVVDGVLLRPLPYPDDARLYTFQKGTSRIPMPDYRDWRDQTDSFDAWAAALVSRIDLTGQGEPERLPAAFVTEQMLTLLGGRLAHGRGLAADDWENGLEPVVVITHDLWTRRFGQDPGLVGRSITLDNAPTTVVGILSPDFRSPEGLRFGDAVAYLPLDVNDERYESRTMFVLSVLARLNADVDETAARAELGHLEDQLRTLYPDGWIRNDGTEPHIEMYTLREATIGDIGGTLRVFVGAVALMLLIACANVANLFLARGMDQKRELALRSALGARRSRLVHQLLTESVLLALAGGLLGVVIAWLGVEAFRTFNPGGVPRLSEVVVDWRVLTFAMATAGLTGIAFGLVPALTSSAADPQIALREGGTNSTSSRERVWMRSGLVMAEMALALVLLVGAGLLFSSFLALRAQELGFEADHLTTVALDIGALYEDDQHWAFQDELVENIEALPGVTAAGLTWSLPIARGHCCWRTGLIEAGDTLSTTLHPVTTGYFDALGMTLLEGRLPIRSDGDYNLESEEPMTVPILVNRAFAERTWPEQSAVEKTVGLQRSENVTLRVVGVVEDVRHWTMAQESGYNAYFPMASVAQWMGEMEVAVRHRGVPGDLAAGLRETIRDMNANLPIGRISTMRSRIDGSLTSQRFSMLLLATFAGIAFVLAAAGIYASMLFDVERRRREIGIRMALGAQSVRVVRMILGRGAVLAVSGVGIGLVIAWTLSRLLESLVFGVTPTDPRTYVTVAASLTGVALLATLVPAMRAARVDPMETLRAD